MNPNDSKWDRVYPTDELLLEEVTDYEIYRYYIGKFQIGRAFSSPFRKDDVPSFGIFPSRKAPGRLFFKDHRGPTGDAIVFVMKMFNYTYKEALERIIIDFSLQDKFLINTKGKPYKPVEYRLDKESRKEYIASKLDLKIQSREWRTHDIAYWKDYGISLSTLKLFNVTPIRYYWMYGKIYTAATHAYAYKEWKDDILNYKVYQPFRTKHKFLNGFLDGTFSGWNLLPEFTPLIIISKSGKDSMLLREFKHYSVSPQGEGYTFKPQVVDILKSKCNHLIQFYDTDETGLIAAERNKKEFGIDYVITGDYNAKDPTDYYKKHGLKKTTILLNKLLKRFYETKKI